MKSKHLKAYMKCAEDFDEPWSTSDLPLIKISKVEDSNDVRSS